MGNAQSCHRPERSLVAKGWARGEVRSRTQQVSVDGPISSLKPWSCRKNMEMCNNLLKQMLCKIRSPKRNIKYVTIRKLIRLLVWRKCWQKHWDPQSTKRASQLGDFLLISCYQYIIFQIRSIRTPASNATQVWLMPTPRMQIQQVVLRS